MLATVIIIVYTNDLSKGVLAERPLSAIFFVVKISTVKITQDGNHYIVNGQLFFASTDGFIDYFKKVKIHEEKHTN